MTRLTLEQDAELVRIGHWVIETCLLFGARQKTAYLVAGAFVEGVEAAWCARDKVTGMEFKRYRRTQIAEMADWDPDFDMSGVSVSAPDVAAGSPKTGDKVARNPANHEDRWLVAAEYFAANFEPA